MKKLLKIIIGIIILTIFITIIILNKNTIMKSIYTIKYSEYVEKYSKEYEIDKYLIYATIKAESDFEEKAESRMGAKGLMQLMDSTAKETAKELDVEIGNNDLYDPQINIMLGTKYLSKMIQKYGNIELALAAYNAGSGKVDSWINENIIKSDGSDIENIPFKETNNYVRKILKDYEMYKELYIENNK